MRVRLHAEANSYCWKRHGTSSQEVLEEEHLEQRLLEQGVPLLRSASRSYGGSAWLRATLRSVCSAPCWPPSRFRFGAAVARQLRRLAASLPFQPRPCACLTRRRGSTGPFAQSWLGKNRVHSTILSLDIGLPLLNSDFEFRMLRQCSAQVSDLIFGACIPAERAPHVARGVKNYFQAIPWEVRETHVYLSCPAPPWRCAVLPRVLPVSHSCRPDSGRHGCRCVAGGTFSPIHRPDSTNAARDTI